MADWTAFGAVVGVVLVLLLVLSWLTQRSMGAVADPKPLPEGDPGERRPPVERSESVADEHLGTEGRPATGPTVGGAPASRAATDEAADATRHSRSDASPATETLTGAQPLSGAALLANVAASQGTFTAVLVVAAVATGVSAESLGVSGASFAPWVLAIGVGLGLGLSAANQGAVHVFRRLDVAFSEELRSLLAPESLGGWAALLLGVLPLVAVFEELLFRAILIGAFSTGFGIDPWLLVVVSSLLFAAGHGAQGVGGIVVTGTLGLVLGAAFVVTESLAAVVVAHYLVNALEFLLHER